MAEDQNENMETTDRGTANPDTAMPFPYQTGKTSGSFKKGVEDYELMSNAWIADNQKAFDYEGRDVGDLKTPEDFFANWTKFKDIEAQKGGTPNEKLQKLKELNARMVGFGKAAWEIEDFEVGMRAFDLAGVLESEGVIRFMNEYFKDSGKEGQEKLTKLYNKVKDQNSDSKVSSGR